MKPTEETNAFVFIGRMALILPNNRLYECFIYTPETEFDDDMIDVYGFIKFPYVYMYKGLAADTPLDDRECGLYIRDNGTPIFVTPATDEEKEMYHISNVAELNPQSFLEKVRREAPQNLSKEDLERINSSGNVLSVDIADSDDFLKQAIKQVIQDKQIVLNAFNSRADKPYGLSNMRSALVHPTQKMSTTRFLEWVSVLDLDWELRIRDKSPNSMYPMKNEVIIQGSDVKN